MVLVAGNKILTADEGEPRQGYENGTDTMGSVSVLDLGSKQSHIIDFTILDTKRDALLNDGVILMKDANPSTDCS